MQYLICRCSETVLEKFVKVVNRVTEEELLQEASASTVNGDEDPILPCQLFLGKSRYFSDEEKGKTAGGRGCLSNRDRSSGGKTAGALT